MPALIVYSREGCHLCDEMIAELQSLMSDYESILSIVDVDADAALEERYGDRVPVLVGEGGEICHYFLDRSAVNAYLGNIR